MRPYFLNVDKSEKQNILDLHKKPYDGYVVRQETSNTQPLMVQDFANDKGGITVKSNGEVSEYNNKIYMRESSGECNECGDYNEEMDEESKVCDECGMYEEVCECGRGYMEEEYDEEFFTNVEDPDNFMSSGNYGEIDYGIDSEDEISEPFVDDVDDEDEEGIDLLMIFDDEDGEPEFDREIDLGKPKVNSQVDKALDMFKRFQKY
jgi:hypothetical protein